VIDIKWLRESPGGAKSALARRQKPSLSALVDDAVRLDAERRALLQQAEQLKAERNAASAEVGRKKARGEEQGEQLQRLKALSDRIKQLDQELRTRDEKIQPILLQIPNPTLPDVPEGDASANRTVRTWGTPQPLGFEAQPHWALGERLGLMDLPRGAKIAGSGFPLFTGNGARLVRALVALMLDLHTREHGYVEVLPPLLVNRDSAQGTGQLPDLESNMYVTEDGFYQPASR
jgi:seryl-tRNA synthetase